MYFIIAILFSFSKSSVNYTTCVVASSIDCSVAAQIITLFSLESKMSLFLKITWLNLHFLVLKCEIPNFRLEYHQNPGSPKVAIYIGVSGEG